MKPRPRYANAHQMAMARVRKLHDDDRAELAGIITGAFAQFKLGRDCRDNWAIMADALNTAEMLADMGIASDADSRERVDNAMRVLDEVWERSGKRGWTLRAAEMQALDDGLWMARVQLDYCSLGELARAREKVAERVRHARAGNVPAGAHVVGNS